MWYLSALSWLGNHKALVGLAITILYGIVSSAGCQWNAKKVEKLNEEIIKLQDTIHKLGALRKADALACTARCAKEEVKCLDKKLNDIRETRDRLKKTLEKERKKRKVIVRRVRALPASKLPQVWTQELKKRHKVKPCTSFCLERWRSVLSSQ